LNARPGEVYLADIFVGGTRPVIVVSRPELSHGTTNLAVPVTSARVAERRRYANYVFMPAGTGGLKTDSVATAHLVQPVRSDDLKERWGEISAALLERIRVAVGWSIGLVPELEKR
jgi:mRNA-degrading endonuclease toxin of MazEF toxin-antitoxin module